MIYLMKVYNVNQASEFIKSFYISTILMKVS